MYLCTNCELLFDDPKCVTERHGFDCGPYEQRYCCPHCGGDFVETTRCNECGEYIQGKFVVVNGSECYCDNCYRLLDMRDT